MLDFLATGIVILISIAIAAGVVFLISLIGILWTLFSRKDDNLNKFDPAEADDDDSTTHRPSSLLEHINAATRTTIMGQSPFSHHDGEKDFAAAAAGAGVGAGVAASSDPFGPDASNFARAETPSDALGGIMGAEEASRPAHARYSFDGTGDGELPMSAGQDIEILDDGDAAYVYSLLVMLRITTDINTCSPGGGSHGTFGQDRKVSSPRLMFIRLHWACVAHRIFFTFSSSLYISS
jgi:hypothetical protein